MRDEREPMAEPDRRIGALWEVVLRWERGQRSRSGALQRDQLPTGRQTGHHHARRSRSDQRHFILNHHSEAKEDLDKEMIKCRIEIG